MRVGTATGEADGRKYVLPARNLFDVVATNDLTSLLTLVRGVNPFDHSPGMQRILARMDGRPGSANPFVITTTELDVDPATMGTVRDARGMTALHVAAGYGHSELVEVLLEECGADANATDQTGASPLHAAAGNGHADCVRLLLDHHSDATAITGYGASARGPACRLSAGRTALFLAHFNGHYVTSSILTRYFAEIAERVPHAGDTAATITKKLAEMVRGEDATAFAYFFDVTDCELAGCGPVLSTRPPAARDTVRACLLGSNEVWSCLVPTTAAMSAPSLFIMEGLVLRGFLAAEAATTAAEDRLLTSVLRAGQVEALRRLLQVGYRVPLHEPLADLLPSEEERGEDERMTQMVLLLEEASLREVYAAALKAYRHKPDSKRRKRAAMEAKVAVHAMQKELSAAGLEPLVAAKKAEVC